jgi:hypothetical protein
MKNTLKSFAFMLATIGLIDFYFLSKSPWHWVGMIGFLMIGIMSAKFYDA